MAGNDRSVESGGGGGGGDGAGQAGKEGRILVGGLSWQTDERKLQEAFRRFGKVVDAQIMLERDGDARRHRGFGFVTFEDEQAVESAIKEMHNQELDGRIISVNKAEPQIDTDVTVHKHYIGMDESKCTYV